jgi:hypothetical protein
LALILITLCCLAEHLYLDIFSSNILSLFLALLYFRAHIPFLTWDCNIRKVLLTIFFLVNQLFQTLKNSLYIVYDIRAMEANYRFLPMRQMPPFLSRGTALTLSSVQTWTSLVLGRFPCRYIYNRMKEL